MNKVPTDIFAKHQIHTVYLTKQKNNIRFGQKLIYFGQSSGTLIRVLLVFSAIIIPLFHGMAVDFGIELWLYIDIIPCGRIMRVTSAVCIAGEHNPFKQKPI